MGLGGSIQRISIDGRGFSVAADADATIDPGGKTVEVKSNGDGTTRNIQTTRPWKVAGVKIDIKHETGDLQFLKGVQDAGLNVGCSIEMNGGTVYSGSGIPIGELAASTMEGTMDLELSGEGELAPQ